MAAATVVSAPVIEERPARHYMGIRFQTPFKGMSKAVAQVEKELTGWFQQHGYPEGHGILRYYVIDMAGEMDIEVGIVVPQPLPGTERVTANELPAGRYASVIYTGSGLTGNKTLVDWAKANGIRWDRWQSDKGDAFAARCETYLTDPKIEPRKTKWRVEVAIKLAQDQHPT